VRKRIAFVAQFQEERYGEEGTTFLKKQKQHYSLANDFQIFRNFGNIFKTFAQS